LLPSAHVRLSGSPRRSSLLPPRTAAASLSTLSLHDALPILVGHRTLLIGLTSVVLVLLGALHALGLGFDLGKLLPGFERLQQRSTRGSGLARTFVLGAVGGIAGFCAGPILGAVLTLAMGQGSMFLAGLLLAVYGAGMVVPLTVLAAVWN